MDLNDATHALAALAQGTRLETFRLLIRAGSDGLPAGVIARELDIPANTLSAHLSVLAHAGLVTPRREGRSIIYTADYEGMRRLIDYLLQDCCQGHPEICGSQPHLTTCQSPAMRRSPAQ